MWVNKTKTLWSHRNQDTWRLPLFSKDGDFCGTVVAQVVDPIQCLVRYFVVYSHRGGRRFLLPSDCVESIDSTVRCSIPASFLKQLPPYKLRISEHLEQKVHLTLGRKPYWMPD